MVGWFLFGLAIFSACVSNQQSQSFWSSQDQSDNFVDQEDNEDQDDESAPGGNNQAFGLPHPKGISAFNTRVFISTQAQPAPERIAACFEQMAAIAADATNSEALLEGQNQAAMLIANDFSVYHFCFYQMVVKLDERMAIGGPLMDDLATAFFNGMRRLWILARAMDVYTGKDRYISWLTKRYIAMSREYFGRNIEVLAPPFSKLEGQTNRSFKPASSFPIE